MSVAFIVFEKKKHLRYKLTHWGKKWFFAISSTFCLYTCFVEFLHFYGSHTCKTLPVGKIGGFYTLLLSFKALSLIVFEILQKQMFSHRKACEKHDLCNIFSSIHHRTINLGQNVENVALYNVAKRHVCSFYSFWEKEASRWHAYSFRKKSDFSRFPALFVFTHVLWNFSTSMETTRVKLCQ